MPCLYGCQKRHLIELNGIVCVFTLGKFGLGPVFLSWVKLLYTCPSAYVLTNNHYSKYFDLHCRNRQGCPLSPLLFVIPIEPLAIAIPVSLPALSGVALNSNPNVKQSI